MRRLLLLLLMMMMTMTEMSELAMNQEDQWLISGSQVMASTCRRQHPASTNKLPTVKVNTATQ